MERMSRISRTPNKVREMGLGLTSCALLLHLYLVMCAKGSESKQIRSEDNNIIIQLPGSNVNPHKKSDAIHFPQLGMVHKFDPQGHTDNHHHPSISHMDHKMDPSAMRFFTIEDMFVGKKMPLYFHRTDPSNSPHFLPRDEADSIPFSSKQLPDLLRRFAFYPDSSQAKSMERSLRQCEAEPMEGETNFCATSLESMLDYNRGVFGLNTPFRLVTTIYFSHTDVSFQNYTILEAPKQILATKMVACHSLPYPYAVFYCHSQKSENKVYKVLIGGDNGERMEAVAVCHMDTSQWSRDHASFRVLGIERGTSPVCHFFPADNLIWVPALASI
ncbi:BURP domain protein USPL1 isoform X1 [Ziziphus jujuba]|uniref:BURP domain protein USPL1 isoform X1 n=1 Tax=Ziziphus jujuba TaxID=326968 RepID=A0A6P4A9F9_ZIZJJ|nr:BURP domain protein USPL1 isoform X1 [Ziziphus jujuba]